MSKITINLTSSGELGPSIAGDPVANDPITDNPITDNPVADNPVTDNPVADNPVVDNPATDDSSTDSNVGETLAVPNTGDMTDDGVSGGGVGVGFIISVTLLFAVVGVVALIVVRKLRPRFNRNSYFDSKKDGIRIGMTPKKAIGVSAVALTSLGVIGGIAQNGLFNSTDNENVFADMAGQSLSIRVSDVELDVEASKDGTFAVAPSTIRINTATEYGYVLDAYVSDADLVNQENPEDIIKGLPASGSTSVLGENTWGIATSGVTNADSAVWRRMPTPSDDIMTLKWTDSATPANDEVVAYYGVNVNNKLSSGAYTGTIYYVAVANPNPNPTPDVPDVPDTPVVIPESETIEEAYTAAGKTKVNGYYTLQDMSSSICSSVIGIGTETNIQLIDVRDNEVYLVGKLADGKCWLLDNLRLDPTDSNVASKMSESNTNAPAAAIANFLHGGSSETGWAQAAVSSSASDFGTNAFTTPHLITEYKKTNVIDGDTIKSYGRGSGYIGVYYNYCAASAGTYCYNSSAPLDRPDTLIDAEYDICPANWRMPTSGNFGEYADLGQHYASKIATDTSSLQYNLSTPIAGMYSGGKVNYYDDYGIFTGSTHKSGIFNYTLTVEEEDVGYDVAGSSRSYGFAVRCLAK